MKLSFKRFRMQSSDGAGFRADAKVSVQLDELIGDFYDRETQSTCYSVNALHGIFHVFSYGCRGCKVPDYQRASGISGNLTSIGSDTLANLMTLWAQEFKKNYPNVNVQIPSRWFFNSAASLGRRHSQYGADVTDDERQ